MDFAIELLQTSRKRIEKDIKSNSLMQKNMNEATRELSKLSELKRAIKILKTKNRN